MKNISDATQSLLFSTCYREKGKHGASHERYRRWITYYTLRREAFGSPYLCLIDDGSPINLLKQLGLPVFLISKDKRFPKELPAEGCIFTFQEHLGRLSMSEYPGWWRSFSFSGELAKHYQLNRVLHIESDAYILSQRLALWLSTVQSGWNVLFTPRWGWPESQIQSIVGDNLKKLRAYYTQGESWWFHPRGYREYAEFLLPFTKIVKRFKGDRYTDYDGAKLSQYPKDADFVTQAHLSMRFNKQLR